MIETIEESFDSQNVANKLIDGIINEVIKAVKTRIKDPGFEILKLEPQTNEELLDCSILEGNSMEMLDILKTQDSLNVNSLLSNYCYSGLADLPDMCMHSSTHSTSNQQGEGDYQSPAIRETKAFYRLSKEAVSRNQAAPADHHDCTATNEPSVEPAICTPLSNNNELLQQLNDNLFNMSFDDVELEETVVKSDPLNAYEGLPPSHQLVQMELNGDVESEITLSRCDVSEQYNRPGGLQHSKKFCHYDNGKGFPFESNLLANDNKSVADQNYSSYTIELNEYDDETVEELLSASSQELATVEGQSGMTVFNKTNPFRNPFLDWSPKQSVMHLPRYSSNTSFITTKPVKNTNSIEVMAEVEATQNSSINWEESLEVQVNVTDPVDILGPRVEEKEENENIIQTRQFWSSVGLMRERKIDPKYLGPLDLEEGIESIKGLTLVQEKRLNNKLEQAVSITDSKDSKETESIHLSPGNIRVDGKINYLNLSGKSKKEKKKGAFLTRLTKAVSGIFRSNNK